MLSINSFKTKTKLLNYISSQLQSYEPGDVISEGDFYNLLMEVLHNHPQSDEKIGVGVRMFLVERNKIIPTINEFHVLRVDGSKIDFSYKKAVSGINKHESNVKDAFRNVIWKQTDTFKRKFFQENADSKGYCICEVTGLKFKKENCHVDHIYPKTFDSLFYSFLEGRGIKLKDIKLKTDYTNRSILCDENLAKDFWDWHLKNADLRCIYFRANLQQKHTANFNGKNIELIW